MWAFSASNNTPEAATPSPSPDVPATDEPQNDGSKLKTFISILRK
jgi:hypothetical protein